MTAAAIMQSLLGDIDIVIVDVRNDRFSLVWEGYIPLAVCRSTAFVFDLEP